MISFPGQKVTLGPLDSKYNETLREWRNQYAIWKWCRQNDLITDRDQARWFESQSQDRSIKMYLVHAPQENDRPVGVAGLTSIDMTNGRAEFSLYVAPRYQGLGYGKSALSTLVSHGFLNLGLNSIWGESFDGNPAIKMFESLGFKKEGKRRQHYFRNGKFIDAHLFSILAKEWLSKK